MFFRRIHSNKDYDFTEMIFRLLVHALYILIFGILFISCSGMQISQKIELAEGDWLMAGGSSEQKNISRFELAPPLQKLWDFDIDGGFGYNGMAVADALLFVNTLACEVIGIDISPGGKTRSLGLAKDASTTPLILGNDVILTFAGDDKYSIISHNLLKGNRNWRKNYGYIQTSPMLDSGYVYFGSLDGNEYKINAKTGRLAW